jgi:hypothetical protein
MMLRLSSDERHHRQRRVPSSSSTAGSAPLERNRTNRFESRIAATSGCGSLPTGSYSRLSALSNSARSLCSSPLADHRTSHDGCVHADHRAALDPPAANDRVVADRDPLADIGSASHIRVHDRAVPNVGTGAHADRPFVAAADGMKPHVRPSADHHVAAHDRAVGENAEGSIRGRLNLLYQRRITSRDKRSMNSSAATAGSTTLRARRNRRAAPCPEPRSQRRRRRDPDDAARRHEEHAGHARDRPDGASS